MISDLLWAGAFAALSRFIRLRNKRKHPEKEVIEVHLPEWIKYLAYVVFMLIWFKIIDAVFSLF